MKKETKIFLVSLVIEIVVETVSDTREEYLSHIESLEDAFKKLKALKEKGISGDVYNAAVIEADKLLDKALMEMGTPGKTMGERMKSAQSKFSSNNSVWYAHKIRNQIAHERNFKIDYNKAVHALKAYRQALKDLGAI
jgi:hypothetical protein